MKINSKSILVIGDVFLDIFIFSFADLVICRSNLPTSTSSPSDGDDGVMARPSTLKLTSPALAAPMTGTKNKSSKIPEVMMAEARPMYTRDHILHFNPAD